MANVFCLVFIVNLGFMSFEIFSRFLRRLPKKAIRRFFSPFYLKVIKPQVENQEEITGYINKYDLSPFILSPLKIPKGCTENNVGMFFTAVT